MFVGNRASFETMNRAINQNELRPVIERAFPFSDAHGAYRHFLLGQSFGKVVVSMDEPMFVRQ